MSQVIIESRKKGNGLVALPCKRNGKTNVINLYAGHNSIAVEDWEAVRNLPQIQRYIRKNILVEVNVTEAKEPSKDNTAKYLSFEEFVENIAGGDEGFKPEQGGHFLITLDDRVDEKLLPKKQKSFRIKASTEDARLAAYGSYLKKMGGKPTPKIKTSKLENMEMEDVEEIIKDCYNPDTLAGWIKDVKKDSIRLLCTQQKERIEKYSGVKKD